jgi:hypothetical protein
MIMDWTEIPYPQKSEEICLTKDETETDGMGWGEFGEVIKTIQQEKQTGTIGYSIFLHNEETGNNDDLGVSIDYENGVMTTYLEETLDDETQEITHTYNWNS